MKRLWAAIILWWHGYCFKHKRQTGIGLCWTCEEEDREYEKAKRNRKWQKIDQAERVWKQEESS